MKKRLVIDGSKEFNVASDLPYLGSPKVVDGLLRDYLFDLTAMRTAQLEHGEDPVARLMEKAAELQKIFYGEDARFNSFAWNKPEQLGRALVHDCKIGGETSDAVLRLFIRIAKDYFVNLVAYENDNIDDEQMQQSVDEALDLYTRILTGAGASLANE